MTAAKKPGSQRTTNRQGRESPVITDEFKWQVDNRSAEGRKELLDTSAS